MSVNMRFSTVAAICLLPICGAFAAAPSAPRADVPGTAAQSAPAPAATAAPDAAARHAKRAACLKDAKAKKLVGAEKTSFLKTCMAAP
jgi:psiF repeat-containing protein